MLWGDKTGKLPGRRTWGSSAGTGEGGPCRPATRRNSASRPRAALSDQRRRAWPKQGLAHTPWTCTETAGRKHCADGERWAPRCGRQAETPLERQMNPRASRSSVVTLNSQFKRCIGTWIMWAFLLFHTTLQGKDLSVPLRSLVELQYLLRMKS